MLFQLSLSQSTCDVVIELNITKGGMAWPAALTQPITVTWFLLPDVLYCTLFWPFIATTYGAWWSKGIPVLSIL